MTIPAPARRQKRLLAHPVKKNWGRIRIPRTLYSDVGHVGHVLEELTMSSGIPRIYTSFAEFEREELRRLDSLHTSVDDMVEERFAEELDFGQSDQPRRRGRPRKHPR